MLNNKILKTICFVTTMICITAIVINTKNTALMWWYLPLVIMLGVNVEKSTDDIKGNEND